MKKKVCVFTGTRAEYSRLRPVMKAIRQSDTLELQLVVAGTHLIEKYGNTVELIRKDGFSIDEEVCTLIEGESLITMAKSTGLTITEMATVLNRLKPDYVLLHGDRFEALGAAVATAMLNIPLAHIQGGEVSGSIDESIRHSITKFANIHFVSNAEARQRLVNMGEDEGRVFNVGCPMVDELLREAFISKEDLFASSYINNETTKVRYDASQTFLLVILHPVTTEYNESARLAEYTLEAVRKTGVQTIWLWPNADGGSREIVRVLRSYDNCSRGSRKIEFCKNFPVNVFINLVRQADCIVGNSSVGIREACYYGIPVVNIGSRQGGRARGSNVIDAPVDIDAIYGAITAQLAHGPYEPEHVYGNGDSSIRIVRLLETMSIGSVQKRMTY